MSKRHHDRSVSPDSTTISFMRSEIHERTGKRLSPHDLCFIPEPSENAVAGWSPQRWHCEEYMR